MNDQTIPAEIVGAETESQDYQHRGELRREYATRITVVINTPDLARIDLTRPITIHQENLPRLEWPGNEKPAPAPALPEGWRLADHPQYGPVVVTSMEPDDAGFVWFVRTDPYGGSEGYDAGCCKPDVLTFLAQGADTSATEGGDTTDAVPESTLAVGSVWDDADALEAACEETGRDQIVVVDKRGRVGVWDTVMQCRRVSAPHADFAPYTIINAGKKADQ